MATSDESDQKGTSFVTAHNVGIHHFIITSSGKCVVDVEMNYKMGLVGVKNIIFLQYSFT